MNSYVQVYKKYLQDTGQQDDRTDYQITQKLGELANQNDPTIFDKYPDFAEEWASIREANAPSLGSEVGRGFKRAGIGLGSTALGAGALVTGSDYLKRKASALDLMASDPDLAPTIGTMDDVRSGRDALRYGLSKVGEVLPSLAESVAVAGAGAVIGSASAPGPGTIAGGVAGVLGKSTIKAALREMLKKGTKEGAESIAEGMVKKKLLREASEEGIEEAIKAGVKPVIETVANNAKRISKIRGGIAANTANSYALSSGEIYNDTDDRGLALGLGAVAAVPDTILPAYLLTRMFPGVALSEARKQGKNFVARLATEGLKTSGIEASTEAFQEGVNVVAKKLKEGTDPTDFNDQDWVRLREAAITGAAGGALVAPAAAIGGRTQEVETEAPAAVAPPVAPVVTPPVVEPVETDTISPVRRVMAMSPEQQVVRVAELESREMVGDEPQEYELLKQVAPTATPTEDAIQPTASPELSTQPTAPNEEIAQSEAPIYGENRVASATINPLPAATQPVYIGQGLPSNETVVGQAPNVPVPLAPNKTTELKNGLIAPVVFAGVQEGLPAINDRPAIPDFDTFTLTEAIPGHPIGSTLSRATLEGYGYTIPEAVRPVDIGNRDASVSTGTGVPTQFEQNMIADWKASIAAEQQAVPVPQSSPAPLVPTALPTSTPPQQLASVAGSAPNIDSGVETVPTAAPGATPVATPVFKLGEQLVKIPAKRAKTGEMIEVEMTAKKAEKMLVSRMDVMQKLINCLGA